MARGEAIVLIGFMGSGKSSVGRLLAARTGLPLYDTDCLLAESFGLRVAEIFAQRGEEAFRAAETDALAQLPLERAIIVTGGGAILRPENRSTIQRLGVVAHLAADEETLFQRISQRPTRPLLQTDNPRATLAKLLRAREPLYHELADVTVDTSPMTHEEVATAVLEAAEKFFSNDR